MKKILFVHHVSSIGGGSYCLLNLLKEVDRSKFQPIVLLQGNGPLVAEIEKLGIKVHFLHVLSAFPYNKSLLELSTWISYLRIIYSMVRFRKVLLEIKPDILYLNNSMLNHYLKEGKKLGVKTIIHIREHWPLNEHKLQLRWFQQCIYNYADRIIAINKYSAQMVPFVEDKTIIVYDWIDFSNRYKEHDLAMLMGESASDKKVFLFTGGFQRIKGALEVFKTFSSLCGDDCRLLVLGANRQDAFAGLRGIVKRILLHLGYKVMSVRVQEQILNDRRIVCIPSTYAIKDIIEKSYCVLSYFTIPHANLTLAESIILKVPMIAASTPESEEYSSNGKYSKLFSINNLCEFEQAILNIDTWRAELKERLEEGSLFVAEMFDKQLNANRFRQVLDQIN
ncbi:glycosyltransferase [Eubacterium ventriosum]|uniref:glycosyltransferase n=1 Tax=Eubacterium ventriosum TaxID=39496 RepID=UPI003AB3712F